MIIRKCADCEHGSRGADEYPCYICLDYPSTSRTLLPYWEAATPPGVPSPETVVYGKATGITADQLKQCTLCGDRCPPVVVFIRGMCATCFALDQAIRDNPLLARKILRNINHETTHNAPE